MYATDVRQKHRLMHNNRISIAPYAVVISEALAAGRISVQWKPEEKKCIHSNEITMSGSKNPITGCDRLAGKVSTINAGRLWLKSVQNITNRLCAWRHNIPPPLYSPVGAQSRASPSRCNVAVLSHAEYVPTLTAAAWRGLSLCQFLGLYLFST